MREYSSPDYAVVAFAMTDDAKKVAQLHRDLNLTFPSLNGKTLRLGYAVETTPRFVGSPSPPTITGVPRSSGCRSTSIAAMNSSMSTWKIHLGTSPA